MRVTLGCPVLIILISLLLRFTDNSPFVYSQPWGYDAAGIGSAVDVRGLHEDDRSPVEFELMRNTPVYTYRVLNIYPHDPSAFTQGLAFEDGFLFEGTGLRGQSTVRQVALPTGEVLKIRRLRDPFFGEGVTLFGNRIIQLTWRAQIGFIYDKNTFRNIGYFNYSTEGWGITHDEHNLIMSDGSATLTFLHPTTYEEVRRIKVHDVKGPVTNLNELEYVKGEIFANVWQTDRIVRISPRTGRVVGWIDLEGLLNLEDRLRRADVLNGIAYDKKNERLFVTGKLWPKLFDIELIRRD